MGKLTTEYLDIKSRIRSWIGGASPIADDLRVVRDKKLFRQDGYSSFDDFCEKELGMTGRWARQIIQSTEVVTQVAKTGTVVPVSSERQARELAKVPEEKREEVWNKASKDGKPTAAKVTEAAKEVAIRTDGKISAGPSFHVDEIEAASPPTQKPKPKNGRPTISTAGRKAASVSLGQLIRALEAIGLYEEFEPALSQIAERLRKA